MEKEQLRVRTVAPRGEKRAGGFRGDKSNEAFNARVDEFMTSREYGVRVLAIFEPKRSKDDEPVGPVSL